MSETVTKTVSTKKRMSVKDLTTLGLLTGILLVMAFTPLGYFHTLGVDISLMMIPVGIGAMLMALKQAHGLVSFSVPQAFIRR